MKQQKESVVVMIATGSFEIQFKVISADASIHCSGTREHGAVMIMSLT